MKKIVITCMFVSASVGVFAQAKTKTTTKTATTTTTTQQMTEPHDLNAAQVKAAQQKAEKRSKALQTKLNLTQDQYEKVLTAETRYQKNVDMYPVGRVPAGFLSNITSERNNYIEQALTAEQYEKYKAMNK